MQVLSHSFMFSSVQLMRKHAQKWGESEMTKTSGVVDIWFEFWLPPAVSFN